MGLIEPKIGAIMYWLLNQQSHEVSYCLYVCVHSWAVLGGFLGFPEIPSEIARALTIRLDDKNYKELYILFYIMAFSIG